MSIWLVGRKDALKGFCRQSSVKKKRRGKEGATLAFAEWGIRASGNKRCERLAEASSLLENLRLSWND